MTTEEQTKAINRLRMFLKGNMNHWINMKGKTGPKPKKPKKPNIKAWIETCEFTLDEFNKFVAELEKAGKDENFEHRFAMLGDSRLKPITLEESPDE